MTDKTIVIHFLGKSFNLLLNGNTYKFENGVIEDRNATGKLDSWIKGSTDRNNSILTLSANKRFQFDNDKLLKILKTDDNRDNSSILCSFGVFSDESKRNKYCVFAPIWWSSINDSELEISDGIQIRVLKKDGYCAPYIFIAKIESDDTGNQSANRWFTYVRPWENYSLDSVIKLFSPLESNIILNAVNASHLVSFPVLSSIKGFYPNSYPVFTFEMLKEKARLIKISNFGEEPEKLKCELDFKSLGLNDLNKLQFLEGNITNSKKTNKDEWKFGHNPNEKDLASNEFIQILIKDLEEIHDEKMPIEAFRFDLEIDFKKVEIDLINGSMALNHTDSMLTVTKLKLNFVGNWDRSVKNNLLYPYFEISQIPCSFSYSPLTDLAAQNNNAVFDTSSLKEDELHREGGVVISKFDDKKLETKIATLNIRIKTQKDRNAIVEWSIKGEQKSKENTPKPKALYFQAKPFSVAQIELPDHEDEGGEQIAFWRSDDPEGAQWRIADSEMKIILPPQAVGEEMERGSRFWIKDDKNPPNLVPYIDPIKPIKYRFSPPTTLTVMPGTKVRRYNAVPNNLQLVLKESIVKDFDTEIVYPINTKFKVNSEGLPHIRISETAFFTGKPTENLPPYPKNITSPKEIELKGFYQDVLADEIGEYTYHNKDTLKVSFEKSYKSKRLAHSAVRANWASRIAQYHLYDPYRADGKLMLSEGLTFKIRNHVDDDAPPLINPLPNGVTEPSWITEIEKFLINYPNNTDPKIFIKNEDKDGAKKHGALRAGVIYTIEFESDLRGVLTDKSYESTEGIIEELSFTPLGANGYISASFNGGKKIFKARVHHGQISRLESITIGRLGVVWNKARHVIVYERTTVPSEQFKGEQGDDGLNSFLGWPIIRKTEEYIEPIEIKRKFDLEIGKDLNACGFIESSEFISQKIYVNSAWGKNYEHGYAIPLWKTDETNSVYAKPTLTLNAFAGEETTKQVLKEPEHLYFYANTEAANGKDSDQWKPQIEIDLPEGLCRLPVITGAHLKNNSQKIISTKQMPAPNTSVSSRRPRYDLAVCSAGPVNLQHKRGETQMLAAMHVISMARTGEVAVTIEKSATDKLGKISENYQEFVEANNYEGRLKQFTEELLSIAYDQINKGANCDGLATSLRAKKAIFIESLKIEYKTVLENNLIKNPENIAKKISEVSSEFIKSIVDIKPDFANSRTQELIKKIFNDLRKQVDSLNIDLKNYTDENLKNLNHEISNGLNPAVKLFEKLDTDLLKAISFLERFGVEFNIKFPNIEYSDELAILKDNIRNFRKELIDLDNTCFNPSLGKNKYLDFALTYIIKLTKKADDTCNVILERVDAPKNELKDLVDKLNSSLNEDLIKILKPSLADAINELKNIPTTLKNEDIYKLIYKFQDGIPSKITDQIKADFSEIDQLINKVISNAESDVFKATIEIQTKFNAELNNAISQITINIKSMEEDFLIKVIGIEQSLIKLGTNWLDVYDKELDKTIEKLEKGCQKSEEYLKELVEKSETFITESKEQLTNYFESVIDRNTQQEIQELAKKYEAKADSGLKLVKALGDMPKLDSLDFNALAAEYVFGDFDKAISTSPYAVKLKEVGDALNGLGLTLPSTSILDQFVPNSLDGLNFRDIFNNMGGMDFKHLFEKFKLDDKLKSENIIVTHGLDKATRQAWVKAEVKANLPEKQSLFELSGIGVSTTNLKLNAISEQRVDLQGKRQSINNGKFISDFALDFSGNKLAVFKEVSISFDNGKFDFDISPDKIELHPSIKFVSDIAKQIQGSLPPYIEVVKDANGNTNGVRSSMNIEVANPPDFGAVKIGTLILYSGIQLQMVEGKFEISAFLSVGKKETPIFLQIGELGGGMWLETTATQVGPNTLINASLGLAVGNTRRKNIGSVASGEYSIMLFAYANYQIENGRTASQFRAGISVYGSARVLSIANATIFMLLEAIHDSQNGSKGVGILDISISMGRFYKIKIKKQVEQAI